MRAELDELDQSAVACVGEGFEETLTLHRLGVFALVGRSPETINVIESVSAQAEQRGGRVSIDGGNRTTGNAGSPLRSSISSRGSSGYPAFTPSCHHATRSRENPGSHLPLAPFTPPPEKPVVAHDSNAFGIDSLDPEEGLRRSGGATRRCLLVAVASAGAVLAGACSSNPTSPDTEDLDFTEIIFVSAETGEDILWSHGDHFHGALRVGVGEVLPLLVEFLPRYQDAHDAPPESLRFTLAQEPEYRLRAIFADATIARWEGDRHRVQLAGNHEGTTRVTVQVRRTGRLIYEAPGAQVYVNP